MATAWMDHVKAVRKQHPSKSLKEALQMAAKTYKKGSGAATKKVVGKKSNSGTAKKGKMGKTMKKRGTAKKGKGKGKGKGKSAKKGKKSKSSARK